MIKLWQHVYTHSHTNSLVAQTQIFYDQIWLNKLHKSCLDSYMSRQFLP